MSLSNPPVTVEGDAPYLLSATALRKSYGKPSGEHIDVIDGISLDIPPRKVISIIGPSGSGKSTLLRLLAGIERPDEGCVTYHYNSNGEPPPIPMVLQTAALLPWRTVKENIALSLELLRRPDCYAEAEHYAGLVGLGEFLDFLPRDLSGGMRARVSIARALTAASQLVLFDEAFTELDEVTRQTLNDLFCQHVERDGLAAVAVSHDIGEAVYLADVLVVLTKRPAQIARMFEVTLARPRRPSLRSTSEFLSICDPVRTLAQRLWQ